MRGARRAAVLTAAAALVLSGCGSDDAPPAGWSGRYSDSGNTASTSTPGLDDVTFSWTRPTGGMVGSPVTIAPNGQIFVTATTDAGCNLFSFRVDHGRKRWCTRLAPGVADVSPLVDEQANIYVGEGGGFFSFNEHGQRRWRIPVSGTPRSAQFAPDGSVVVVTHFGQVNVVDPQTGRLRAPVFDLLPLPGVGDGTNIPRQASDHGLAACFGGSPDCPVATTPAVDPSSGRILTTVWRPGADRAALVALRYTGGDDAVVTEEWSFDDLPGGAVTSPVLSADGTTVYVHDGTGALWALDAATGAPRWNHDVGFVPSTGPAVTPDGTLVLAAGGDAGPLVAVRDGGDAPETVWERDDVRQIGVPALTANGRGYTVVDGEDEPVALVFDLADGTTVDQEPLEGTSGFSPGTAVGPDGELVTVTVPGDVYVLAAPTA
ncbi:outer membrane protein assembly factor BamB family protein [Rhodococcus yananensis]|uniref:outer membrane protein assembly factor BamB family protein n=1 Tax=Rhodococcus yananensis TaxID=2879464 RepID=UPI001CF82A5E|nr:PQQ-binding-like beta-propeller repeat protein [Rhodococcus yananensis]